MNLSTNVNGLPVIENRDVALLASGASVSLIGKVFGRGLHILGQIALARYLGPEIFGLYSIGWTIMRLIGVVSPLGLNNGVIRFASTYWKKDQSRLKSVLIQSIRISLVVGLLIGAIEFIAAPWFEQVYGKEGLTTVIRWFAIAVPFLTGLRVAASATRISQRMKYAVISEDIGQPLANLILIALVYLAGRGLLGAAAAETISLFFGFLLALYFIRKLFSEVLSIPIVARQSTRELLLFSLPTVFTGMFSMLIIWTDRLLIGFFRPAADVGIYQAVSQSSTIFALILSGINAMFAPMIARLYDRGENQRLNDLYTISTKWGLYLSLPVFLTIFFASKEIMNFIFGPEYEIGYLPLLVLAVGQLINVATGAVAFMLMMTGRQNDWLVISFSAWVLNLITNLLLIPPYGMVGSAIATSASVSVLFLAGLFRVKIKLNMWPYDWRYLKGVIAVIAASVVLIFTRFISVDIPAIYLILVATIASITFALTLFTLGLDAEDKEYLDVVRIRLGIKGKAAP